MLTEVRSHASCRACFRLLFVLTWVFFSNIANAEDQAESAPSVERIEVEKYSSGTIRQKSVFRDEVLAQCVWYRPDGTVLDSTDFDQDRVGWSYVLRDDGSIRVMWQSDLDRACEGEPMVHGMAIFMNPAQTKSMVLFYKDGVCTDPKKYEQALKMAILDERKN